MEFKSKKVIAKNRKAKFDYHILDTYEAGIVLKGSEVKSIRQGKVSLSDAFAQVVGREIFIFNMHISPYEKAQEGLDSKRDRKLLLKKSEIRKIDGKLKNKGLTLIPLEVYLKKNLVKIALAVAKGKKEYEKRGKIIEKEQRREMKKYI
ncbi:SsrA-binding protein SmpB [candidate division WOR-3 bacterium]|nr:SsrA-binding protein SmpB [candidate division WOR-3 bacterium]